MTLPIVILGNGGHARVVADACRAGSREVRGFLAPQTGGEEILGGDELLDSPDFVAEHAFVVGITDHRIRRRLAISLREKGGRLTSIVHPSAVIAAGVRMGEGTFIAAGAIVNPGTVLGDLVIVNTGATVDHDCVIEHGVHIGPGAHLAGGITCAENALIGVGAAIVPGRRIGVGAIVGAGAAVVRDVPDGVTVVGCPAKPVR